MNKHFKKIFQIIVNPYYYFHKLSKNKGYFKLFSFLMSILIMQNIYFLTKDRSYNFIKNLDNMQNFRNFDKQYDKLCGFDKVARIHGQVRVLNFRNKEYREGLRYFFQFFNSSMTGGMIDGNEYISKQRTAEIYNKDEKCIKYIKNLMKENKNGKISRIYKEELKEQCFKLYILFFDTFEPTKNCEIARLMTFPSKEFSENRMLKLYINHKDIDDMSCGEKGLYHLIKENFQENDYLGFK